MSRRDPGLFCLEMRVLLKRVVFVVPAFVFATAFALVGYDTLNAHSATAPAGKADVLATTAPTPSLASSSIPQPAPAVPSPRITAATVRTGNTLTIPSLGFSGSIADVGLTSGNAIDVPARQVGYWTGSSRPGTPGAAFLDGHVDGVFAKLSQLQVGHTFSVTYGGQIFRYSVVHTETVQLAGIDMNRALSTYNGAAEGLNIMTCAGTYLPSMGTYDQRFVVYAVRD